MSKPVVRPPRQAAGSLFRKEENAAMTTMTMPRTVERTQSPKTEGVSQLLPMVVATVLLLLVGVASILISGPMH